MRTIKILGITAIILAITAFYTIIISFSEHRAYSVNSFDNIVLTPSILSNIATRCKDKPSFIYSASDGPKPTIVTLLCKLDSETLKTQMKKEGFELIKGVYQKENVQIEIVKNSTSETVTSIAHIDYN